MNLMQTAATWLGQQLQTAAGRSVVYVRGTSESSAITAWVSEQRQEVVDGEGFGTGTFVQGWQFVASELIVSGEVIAPRAGDRIKETLLGVDMAWEAMPPGPGQPVAENVDSSGLLVRVWFKRVKA